VFDARSVIGLMPALVGENEQTSGRTALAEAEVGGSRESCR
jgi:hypothetical protein